MHRLFWPFGAFAHRRERSPCSTMLWEKPGGQMPSSGTPGSCLAVRIVSEVFTLATLGAGVSLEWYDYAAGQSQSS